MYVLGQHLRIDRVVHLKSEHTRISRRFANLVRTSRDAYEQHLNRDTWDRAAGDAMRQALLAEVVGKVGQSD